MLIGIPCMDMCTTSFTESLFMLETPAGRNAMFVHNSLVYDAREQIVNYAIEKGYDYLLFIDSDMTFEYDALEKLMATHKSIVGALCCSRNEARNICAWDKVWKDDEGAHLHALDACTHTQEVDAVGTGMMLISTKVLEDVRRRFGTCFQPSMDFGEDIMFCLRARHKDLGYKVWVTPQVKCGHVGQMEYRP